MTGISVSRVGITMVGCGTDGRQLCIVCPDNGGCLGYGLWVIVDHVLRKCW